ncbi:hypothetical protein DKE47_021785 (plasmid) [Acinetobacter nosocomialis]|nr:hypothetical protein DKE47_021785 [Acinetobacter nosocomialis]
MQSVIIALKLLALDSELLLVLFPRPGELRAARWDQFNFETRVWLRPADLMKRRVAHAIPLPKQAIKLLLPIKKRFQGMAMNICFHQEVIQMKNLYLT